MKQEILGQNTVLSFGKNKGKSVADVLRSDPGYLAWLRKERGVGSFDDEVNAAIDAAILKSTYLRKNFDTSENMLKRELRYRGAHSAGRGIAFMVDDEADVHPQQSVAREEFYGEAWGSF